MTWTQEGLIKSGFVLFDKNLVGRPCTELLYISPARQEGVSLSVLVHVVLRNQDRVAQHFSILVAEVVLSEPDGDGVH